MDMSFAVSVLVGFAIFIFVMAIVILLTDRIEYETPRNLEDASLEVRKHLAYETKQWASVNEFLAESHHGAGQWIRNEWGLWQGTNDLWHNLNERFDVEHADDMSSLILAHAWLTLNSIPPYQILDQMAETFRKHWQSMEEQQ